MHGVKRDLRIVRAHLDGEVPAADRGLQVIAAERRQVNERQRAVLRQAEPVLAAGL